MAQISYGTITVSDLTDITDVFLQYAKAVDSVTVTNNYAFSQTGEIGWYTLTLDTSIVADKYYFELINNEYKIVLNPTGNPVTHGWYESSVYPTWTSGYQIWIRQVTIKDGIDVPDYGTPYLDTAVNQINNRIGVEETAREALASRLKKIWVNEVTSGDYVAGTYAASGIENVIFNETSPQTYGFNTLLRHNKLALRYNTIDMTSLTTTALTFYRPAQGSNNNYVQGKKGLELNADSLIFYKPLAYNSSSSETAAATLNSTGLNIVEGSIDLTSSNTDRVHFSTNNLTTAVSINDESKLNWRLFLGDKFGVTNAGYMSVGSGKIGSWTIDSDSIHSSDKNIWDKDSSGIFIGKNEYFLTSDPAPVSGKNYYSFINGNYEVYISNTSFSPVALKLYEKREDFYTISGGRNQYILVDDTEVNENTTYYEIVYIESQDTTIDETKVYYTKENDGEGYYKYVQVLNPTGNPSENSYYEKTDDYSIIENINISVNPQKLGWYKNLGPMWYINSDGTANFGSLVINQRGILNVPAASISGKLNANQIEVDSLWAGNATIGATVDSEATSSNFKADLESVVVSSLDTRIVSGKDYYVYEDNYEEVSLEPEDSPFEKYYVETEIGSGIYVLSYDVEPVDGTTYYELKGSTLVLEDNLPSGTSPAENNYYEKIDSSYIVLRTEKKNYILTDDLEVKNEKNYYYYDYTYFLSEDEKVEKNKNYYENIKELTSDTVIINSKIYYKKIGEGSEVIYERIDKTEANPSAEGWYQDAYVLIPLNTSEDTSGDISIYVPADLKWYEKKTEYTLIEQPQNIIQNQPNGTTPQSLNWYEIESEYSAEINLKNGDIFLSSNDEIVLSTDSQESDLNVGDVDVLKRIKFGNIELIPYEGGFAIKAGGETN